MNRELYDEEHAMYAKSATWELQNVKRALTFIPLLNSERENARLAAVKDILRERNRSNRK